MTADSLTIKQFVQTSDLGAKTVQTKSAQVTGDLVIGGKIVASKHGSIDLIALILQLQSQVADLQEQIATLGKNSSGEQWQTNFQSKNRLAPSRS